MSLIVLPLSKSSLILLWIIFFFEKFIKYFNCLLIRNDSLPIELIFSVPKYYNIITANLILLALLLLLLLIIYLSFHKLFCRKLILFIILIKLTLVFIILLVVNKLRILMSLSIFICKKFIIICLICLEFILYLRAFNATFSLLLLAIKADKISCLLNFFNYIITVLNGFLLQAQLQL